MPGGRIHIYSPGWRVREIVADLLEDKGIQIPLDEFLQLPFDDKARLLGMSRDELFNKAFCEAMKTYDPYVPGDLLNLLKYEMTEEEWEQLQAEEGDE